MTHLLKLEAYRGSVCQWYSAVMKPANSKTVWWANACCSATRTHLPFTKGSLCMVLKLPPVQQGLARLPAIITCVNTPSKQVLASAHLPFTNVALFMVPKWRPEHSRGSSRKLHAPSGPHIPHIGTRQPQLANAGKCPPALHQRVVWHGAQIAPSATGAAPRLQATPAGPWSFQAEMAA